VISLYPFKEAKMEKKKAADAQLIIKFLITSFLLVLIAG
jgi:hypothetical protein